LTDDGPSDKLPTKNNILKWINWLVSENKPGEQLFFHYSGHGSYVTDTSGDEIDGRDECIIPCDYEKSGYILDDELNERLVAKIGKCYLFGVMDSCHSGTALDLNYNYKSGTSVVKTGKKYNSYPLLNAVLLSGCADEQTSADTSASFDGKYENCGALSWSLYYTLKNNPNSSYAELIKNSRNMLSKSKYTQKPQLSFNVIPRLSDKAIKGDKSSPSTVPKRTVRETATRDVTGSMPPTPKREKKSNNGKKIQKRKN
jgi:hypothetical protein